MTLKDQIAAEIAAETSRSAYRDRVTGQRLHPVQADVARLLDFVATRRITYPGALDAARCALRQIDTAALRGVVDAVLEGGATDQSTRRRCERVLGYCDTIDAALALRPTLEPQQSESDIRSICRKAVCEALSEFGDDAASAEVLALVEALPFDGSIPAFVQAVAATSRAVWERKEQAAAERVRRIEEQVARLATIHLMPPSTQTH